MGCAVWGNIVVYYENYAERVHDVRVCVCVCVEMQRLVTLMLAVDRVTVFKGKRDSGFKFS